MQRFLGDFTGEKLQIQEKERSRCQAGKPRLTMCQGCAVQRGLKHPSRHRAPTARHVREASSDIPAKSVLQWNVTAAAMAGDSSGGPAQTAPGTRRNTRLRWLKPPSFRLICYAAGADRSITAEASLPWLLLPSQTGCSAAAGGPLFCGPGPGCLGSYSMFQR